MTNLEWLKGVIAITNLEGLKNLSGDELKKELSTVYNKDWLNAEHVPKIKPCPVCKGEMSTIWQHGGYYLVCKECGLRFGLDTDMAGRGLIEGEYMDKTALIDDWNRRIEDGKVDGD